MNKYFVIGRKTVEGEAEFVYFDDLRGNAFIFTPHLHRAVSYERKGDAAKKLEGARQRDRVGCVVLEVIARVPRLESGGR